MLSSKWKRICGGMATLLMAFSVPAWDGVATGKIAHLEGVGGGSGAPGNYDLRVFLENQPAICPGATAPDWGYVNVSDANYKGLMAIFLTAYTAAKTVTVFMTKDSAGYCRIGYVQMSG